MNNRWLLCAGLIGMLGIAPAVSVSTPARAAEPQLTATDGPGAQSYFDISRKECGGTARNGTSKVTYTVANGVLSDVYYPDMDNTNVNTLQYIVTDGSTFDDLQTRDMTYNVTSPDPSGMVCEVTATANSGDYQLVTDYITDPGNNAVVMHTRFVPLVGQLSNYQVYVRFDPTLNGNGGGGTSNGGGDTGTIDPSTGAMVSYDTHTTTSYAAGNSYRVPVYAALLADRPFLEEESGFVGQGSDGLTQLDAGKQLSTLYTDAANGNVVQTAEMDTSNGGQWTLALDFDQTEAAALSGARASSSTAFSQTESTYSAGWQRYNAGLNAPPTSFAGLSASQAQTLDNQYYLAANLIKASEDKNFPGAIVSSLGGPWGQDSSAAATSGGNPSFNVNYRVIFERDLYETFTGLLADGDLATARNTVYFLFNHEPANGEFPRDMLVNGAVASDNYAYEPDENAYPLVMAYQAGLSNDNSIYPAVLKAANWLISHGPSYGDERWEEQAGYSPSTIAAEIAGLVAAAYIADAHGDHATAQVYRATADQWQRLIKTWTLTTTGPGGNGQYFIRLSKSAAPIITGSSWSNGVETLNFAAQSAAPVVGVNATVASGCPAAISGIYPVTASSTTSLSYALPSNPGACSTSLTVTRATYSTSSGRATVTFGSTTAPSVGSTVVVSGITPAGYNGTFTVYSSSSTTVQYVLTPNPGTYTSGGQVAVNATGSATLPGNPNAPTTYTLGNGISLPAQDQRKIVDAGFLEYARFGVLPANDSDIINSLNVIDSTLEVTTPSGPGWHRYGVIGDTDTTDGYGDCYPSSSTSCTPEGKPWSNGDTGSGGTWPILTGERGEQDLQLGDAADAAQLAWTMYQDSAGIGLVPEQDWISPNYPASPYGTSPATASIGFVDGKPDGSACDITWAEAQEARLILDLGRGSLVDQPDIVANRYVAGGPPSTVPLTISSPNSSTTPSATITGSTSPGASVAVAVTDTSAATGDTETVQATAASDGTFTLTVPTPKGTDMVTASASTGPAATGYAQAQIISTAAVSAPMVTYTGPTAITYGSTVALTATLDDLTTGAGIAGPLMTLTLGSQSCTANVNGMGTASCTMHSVSATPGGYNLSVAFAGDSAYSAVTSTAPVTVVQYTPVLTWANPADITYPTPLSATQLDASSDIAGSFVYTPTASTVLDAGSGQTLTATFTPTDTVDYVSGGIITAAINVDPYTPVLSWATPGDIVYPTALSGTQLDAAADVSGSFAYTPPAERFSTPEWASHCRPSSRRLTRPTMFPGAPSR